MKLIEGYVAAREALLQANAARSFTAQPQIETAVRDICEAVRQEDDAAVLRYERQFDCVSLEADQLRVTPEEIAAAWDTVPAAARGALQHAADNIEAFHRRQPVGNWSDTLPNGARLGQRYTPIPRVGMYAPFGKAVYPSSVLMLAVPGRVAGVPHLVLATPPGQDGKAHPMVLAAAKVAGITEIYKVGGAVAMAALAYGTATIPRVDKIVGPGNIYVTLAKKHLYGTVGIDGLYGPSEVVILVDALDDGNSTLIAQVAADLIAQAEHGPDSFVCCVVTSAEFARAVREEVDRQVAASPRSAILHKALDHSLILTVDSTDQGCELCDLAAAEHVEVWSDEADALAERLQHAGAVFINTPVPLGDYIAGPSHVLPTGVTARFAHGVGVETFLKRTSIIAASPATMRRMADDLEVIALLEDLPGHAAAVRRGADG